MSSTTVTGGHSPDLGATNRVDNWWAGPLATLTVLLGFIVYATWAAFQGDHYWYDGGTQGFGGYLSPLYSPLLYIREGVAGGAPMAHAWIGHWPAWWPTFLPASPALLILPFPGAFRFTCYYYRKAYYRAFTGTPPACAVGALRQDAYKGETSWLLFQNLHRYALYFALIFVGILTYDAVLGCFRGGEFGIRTGSLVLIINAILLAGYTFGCHSFRHLIGGRLNKFSGCAFAQLQHKTWKGCSALNSRHMLMAWTSLVWVAFTDVFVRLVAMGTWAKYDILLLG